MTSLDEDFEKAWRKRHFVPTPNPEYKPGAQEEANKNIAKAEGENEFKRRLKDRLSDKGSLTGIKNYTVDDTDYSVKDRLTPAQKGALHRKENKMQTYQDMPKKSDFDGTTKTTIYPPSKEEAIEASKTSISERPNNVSELKVVDTDKIPNGKKPVSASERKEEDYAERSAKLAEVNKLLGPQKEKIATLRQERDEFNKDEVDPQREVVNDLKKVIKDGVIRASKYDRRTMSELQALIKMYPTKWHRVVEAVSKGKDSYGNDKTHKVYITPEVQEKVKFIADQLSLSTDESHTVNEQDFLKVWNGKGRFEDHLNANEDLANAERELKEKIEEKKGLTKKAAKLQDEYNRSLAQAEKSPDDGDRRSIDFDVTDIDGNVRRDWKGFRVARGGANAGYAMHINKTVDGKYIAEGFALIPGTSRPDTDRGRVYYLEVPDGSEASQKMALLKFKTAMEGRTDQVLGSFAPFYAKLNKAEDDYITDQILNQDFDQTAILWDAGSKRKNKDETAHEYGYKKLINAMRNGGLVVDKVTNKIVNPTEVTKEDTFVPYTTKEDEDADRVALYMQYGDKFRTKEGKVDLDAIKNYNLTKRFRKSKEIGPDEFIKVVSASDTQRGAAKGKGIGGSVLQHTEYVVYDADGNKLRVLKKLTPTKLKNKFSTSLDESTKAAKESLKRQTEKQDDSMDLGKEKQSEIAKEELGKKYPKQVHLGQIGSLVNSLGGFKTR